MTKRTGLSRAIVCATLAACFAAPVLAEPSPVASSEAAERPTFSELRDAGIEASRYRNLHRPADKAALAGEAPTADLATFRDRVRPILEASCIDCHGPDTSEGNVRVDQLDPNLFTGGDASWWLEVLAVVTNREMPPPDTYDLSDEDRSAVIDWLSSEVGRASAARRAEGGHTSFRRLTRYEYAYALQDLLGLPLAFGKDLPPEPVSEDGFENSAEMLHMSSMQLAAYRESARKALNRVTVRGAEPKRIYWAADMESAAAETWANHRKAEEKLREKHADDAATLELELEKLHKQQHNAPGGTHYKDLETGAAGRVQWNYNGARFAWAPQADEPQAPKPSGSVAVIPPRQRLIIEIGDRAPELGTMRVRARASRASLEGPAPSLQLEYGWQASNDSQATVRVDAADTPIEAPPGEPVFYEWEFRLDEVYPRNSFRGTTKMGDLPNPSEYLRLVNSSVSRSAVRVDYVEVVAPVYASWPPESHTRLLGDGPDDADESSYARGVLRPFMRRAWRREVTDDEVQRKVALFERLRPDCADSQEAMVETLASVISSPQFLYVTSAADEGRPNQFGLAARLAMFLWCSTPDDRLLDLAARGELAADATLRGEVDRLLADPRSRRFAEQFVRQWLGTDSIAYLDVDKKAHRGFDAALREAMQEEPVAFFEEVLHNNHSVLDFLHADYTLANARLAKHYGLRGVHGNHFRRVALPGDGRRGGLLTLPGLLAMNSDGKDSHPLKRGIWLLERMLNDPPAPPPPAVPEIDVADPEIAKMSLKERLEDHRNDPACLSCHANIDPWGIAFENFDAVGRWREEYNDRPIDATAELPSGARFDGVEGLKRHLLSERQDQFVRAIVHKMATFALGRPMAFGDRAAIDDVAAKLRGEGDGLATLVTLLATSDLFTEPTNPSE